MAEEIKKSKLVEFKTASGGAHINPATVQAVEAVDTKNSRVVLGGHSVIVQAVLADALAALGL